MVRWIDALAKTRGKIGGRLTRIFSNTNALDTVSLEELEDTLIGADVPARLAMEWIQNLEQAYKGLRVNRFDKLKESLIKSLTRESAFLWQNRPRPSVMLIVGVNGSGKTTTCAKLARQAQHANLRPLLGATDTFRAAGADQLRHWAERVGCDVVGGAPGADAAAVAYDALDAAVAREMDVLIVDTAGRMHTRQPLMQELQKVQRALSKRVSHAPDEVWVVLDAALGHNAVAQARVFHKTIPLTGAVIAKLDGSSKAGFVFSVERELGVPIRMVGLGEGLDDLAVFDPHMFVQALMGNEGVTT